MKRIALAIAAAGLTVTTAHAQAPAAPYEIVHPGDSALSCDLMAREIATLGMDMQQASAAAQEKQLAAQKAADQGRMARGIGGAMFSQAAAFGIGRLPFGALANPVLMNGLAHAAAAGGQAIASGGAGPAQAATVSEATSAGPAQRQQYLMSLFKSKSC